MESRCRAGHVTLPACNYLNFSKNNMISCFHSMIRLCKSSSDHEAKLRSKIKDQKIRDQRSSLTGHGLLALDREAARVEHDALADEGERFLNGTIVKLWSSTVVFHFRWSLSKVTVLILIATNHTSPVKHIHITVIQTTVILSTVARHRTAASLASNMRPRCLYRNSPTTVIVFYLPYLLTVAPLGAWLRQMKAGGCTAALPWF